MVFSNSDCLFPLQGKTLVEFLQSMIPIKYQHSKKLISHDVNSNTYNYKYTFSVEVRSLPNPPSH